MLQINLDGHVQGSGRGAHGRPHHLIVAALVRQNFRELLLSERIHVALQRGALVDDVAGRRGCCGRRLGLGVFWERNILQLELGGGRRRFGN